MKKIIWLFVIMIIITGCKKEEKKEIINKEETTKEEIIEEKEVYVDDNPIKIAFYEGKGPYKKLTNYSSSYGEYKEIGVFSMLLSDEDTVSGNSRKTLYHELSSKYENFNNYKIGYSLKFQTEDGEVYENILEPHIYDKYPFNSYIYVWLYDDINTTGWHSHIEENEYNDNTIMSSIKLMWAPNATKIISPVELSVFTYDADDFDENNHYRGNSINSVIIEKK